LPEWVQAGSLAILKRRLSVVHLEIHDAKISRATLTEINKLKNLESVWVYNCSLPTGFFSSLSECQDLRTISAAKSPVSKVDLLAIAAHSGLRSISLVNVSLKD